MDWTEWIIHRWPVLGAAVASGSGAYAGLKAYQTWLEIQKLRREVGPPGKGDLSEVPASAAGNANGSVVQKFRGRWLASTAFLLIGLILGLIAAKTGANDRPNPGPPPTPLPNGGDKPHSDPGPVQLSEPDRELERWVQKYWSPFSMRRTLDSIDKAHTAADLATAMFPVISALDVIEDDSPPEDQERKLRVIQRLVPPDSVFGPFSVDIQPLQATRLGLSIPLSLTAIEQQTSTTIIILNAVGLERFAGKNNVQLSGSVTGFGPAMLTVASPRLK